MQPQPSFQSGFDRRHGSTGRSSIFTREPLLLIGLVLAACYFGRSLLIPLALALTLCFLLAPLVTRLEKMRLGRTSASLLALTGASLALGGIVWLAGNQLLRVVGEVPSHAVNLEAKLAHAHVPASSSLGQAIGALEGLGRQFSGDEPQPVANAPNPEPPRPSTRRTLRRAAEEAQSDQPTQPLPVVVVQAPSSELASLRQLVRPLVQPLGTALMVLVFAVYMLIKQQDLRNRMLLLAGIGRLNLVSHALDDAADRISRYLIANVSVNAGFGVVFGAGLYAIGIPYFALWGALLALLRTIPYAGPLVGGALPTLFALVYFPTWWQAGAVFALIALLEILVSNFLEPWLYGSHTGISELALLAMAIVWTLLWGWPGLALSTPLTVALIVLGRTMPQMSFLHVLLGDDAELGPEARFYERMLAMDHAEARNIADLFLVQRTPLALYDTVLLPALALAENERHRSKLEEPRAQFFLHSIAELVAELALSPAHNAQPPAAKRGVLVCVPASDDADQLAAVMLAQLVEHAGQQTTMLLSPSLLHGELLANLATDPETVLCISALPPFAFSAARALYVRLRAELKHNRIVIGMWQSHIAPALLEQRFALTPGDGVTTTLSDAMALLEGKPTLPTQSDEDWASTHWARNKP